MTHTNGFAVRTRIDRSASIHIYPTAGAAEAIAAPNNAADDDGWSYVVEPRPGGPGYVVEVYDEDNHHVATL